MDVHITSHPSLDVKTSYWCWVGKRIVEYCRLCRVSFVVEKGGADWPINDASIKTETYLEIGSFVATQIVERCNRTVPTVARVGGLETSRRPAARGPLCRAGPR